MSLLNLACSTCANAFKHGDGSGDAAGWAILFMLGVIVPMMVGVGFFLVRMARREKANFDPRYNDDF